jgi:hypothetical protein
LTLVADLETQNFNFKNKFYMEHKNSMNHENDNDANRLLAAVPSSHHILTEMPNGAYHFGCLWNPDGKGWEEIKEIHPMSDLHRSFVKQGIVAFPRNGS